MLKVKTKDGQHVVSDLAATETVLKLKQQISQLARIPADNLHILSGFPPKPLNLTSDDESLASAGIKSGDTLIVEAKQGGGSNTTVIANDVSVPKDSKQIEDDTLLAQRLAAEEDGTNVNSEGILLKQVVPSDNSCLFTSIGMLYTNHIYHTIT